MNLLEKATIIHYHRHRLTSYQHQPVKALGWKEQSSQQQRFTVLTQGQNFHNQTVLDIGCGYGDLKTHLDQRADQYRYIGIDQMPEFIQAAKARFQGQANTFFYQADVTTFPLPCVDHIIASGFFGYRSANPRYYLDTIARLFAKAKHRLAFNMLDQATFVDHPLLIGHNKQSIYEYCCQLSLRVQLIDDYRHDDFTVIMQH